MLYLWKALLFCVAISAAHSACTEKKGVACLKSLLNSEDSIVPRIAGGSAVEASSQFPYVANLRNAESKEHVCAGVLVSPALIVTAAQCVDPRKNSRSPFPEVVLGSVSLNGDSGDEVHTVCKTIIHRKFSGREEDGHNIALLLLDKPSRVTPIELDAAVDKVLTQSTSEYLTEVGWGGDREQGKPVSQLMQHDRLRRVNSVQCVNPTKWYLTPESVVCVDPDYIIDTCAGRGSLLVRANPVSSVGSELVGVYSFGGDCGGSDIPRMYTQIKYYSSWIRNLGRNEAFEFKSGGRCKEAAKKALSPVQLPIASDSDVESGPINKQIREGSYMEAASLIVLSAISKGGPKVLREVAEVAEKEGTTMNAARAFVNAFEGLESVAKDAMDVLLNAFAYQETETKIQEGDIDGAAESLAAFSKLWAVNVPEKIMKLAFDSIKADNYQQFGWILVKAVNDYGGDESVIDPAIEVVLAKLNKHNDR